MRTSDEHTKIARVALDFWPDLDSAFDLNVAKARVNLPTELKSQLQPHVEQLAKQARKAYSPPSEVSSRPQSIPCNNPVPTSDLDSSHREGHSDDIQASSPAQDGLKTVASRDGHISLALNEAASAVDESAALMKIRKMLKIQNPDIAREIGW